MRLCSLKSHARLTWRRSTRRTSRTCWRAIIGAALQRRLAAIKDPAARLDAANELLRALEESSDSFIPPIQQLHALRPTPGPGQTRRFVHRPKTPLNDAALLTNAHGEPSLASELRAEIDSADSIDLLCAFVMWHGLRLIEDELETAREAGVPIRVITTTYIGGTEREALDRLVRDFGAEVKVQYDAKRTRLHAKAWLLRPRHGLRHGLRRLVQPHRPPRCSKASNGTCGSARRRRRACSTSSAPPSTPTGTALSSSRTTLSATAIDSTTRCSRPRASSALTGSRSRLSGLEVRPYPYQQEMLDAIEVERVLHDRHRNLVVAATGTGKTVIAALDYRSLCGAGRRPAAAFSSSRIAARFSSSRCGPTARCLATATSASCTSAASAPSGGSTSSPASSR